MSKRLGTKKRRLLVDQVIARDGTTCTWCCDELIDEPISLDKDCSKHMTLEHVRPLSAGGTHDLANLALACFGCNNERGSSLDWAGEVGPDPARICVL